ncbi:hypothetical protein H8D36_04190 [archaeon]|nr:hypothetical protein [archaeon]MBL7056934.1 hypothetical protein [Candidatus Woesearchaeota archaeon]
MHAVILIVLQAIIVFIGFGAGRFGDRIGGSWNCPHHWILGLILVIIGAFYTHNFWGLTVITFGAGFFVSDLDDFLHMRIYGPDEPHKWRFWSIK